MENSVESILKSTSSKMTYKHADRPNFVGPLCEAGVH